MRMVRYTLIMELFLMQRKRDGLFNCWKTFILTYFNDLLQKFHVSKYSSEVFHKIKRKTFRMQKVDYILFFLIYHFIEENIYYRLYKIELLWCQSPLCCFGCYIIVVFIIGLLIALKGNRFLVTFPIFFANCISID